MKRKAAVAMTAKRVESIKAGPKRMEYPAGPPGGTMLVVHPIPSTKKTWALRYRFLGRTRNKKLGVYPIVTLAEARAKALLALRDLEKGIDPATKPAKGADSVLMVAEEWLKRDVAGQATAYETERVLRKEIIEPWKSRRVSEIRDTDVLRLLDAVVDRGAGAQANKIYSILKRWFGWQVSRHVVSFSPMTGMKPPAETVRRDRALAESELGAVWDAAKTLAYPHGPFLQMLILTGQRNGQTALMRWSEINLSTGVWSAPPANTKMKQPLEIPLSRTALDVLSRVPRVVGGDYVFSHDGGHRPMRNIDAAKKAVDTAAQDAGHTIEPWILHDLRRNIKTFAAQAGIPPHITELVISHSRNTALGSVASIYDQWSYLPEKRAALEAWADYLKSLEEPKSEAKPKLAAIG